MDIIANKNIMTAPVQSYQASQIQPVAVHRSVTGQQSVVSQAQAQAELSPADKESLEDAMAQMQDAT